MTDPYGETDPALARLSHDTRLAEDINKAASLMQERCKRMTLDVSSALALPPRTVTRGDSREAQLEAALARCAQLRIQLGRFLGISPNLQREILLPGGTADAVFNDEAARLGIEDVFASSVTHNALARELAQVMRDTYRPTETANANANANANGATQSR